MMVPVRMPRKLKKAFTKWRAAGAPYIFTWSPLHHPDLSVSDVRRIQRFLRQRQFWYRQKLAGGSAPWEMLETYRV